VERAVPLLLAAAATAAWPLVARPPGPPADGTVEHVVDGDTIVVREGGRSETVRLLGIDTPETVDPDEPVGCFGPEASRFAHRLLDGRHVRLVYDVERRDRYGRLLAYVYVDGSPPLFANASLVAGGYARTLDLGVNRAHAAELAALERSAALAGRGLWGACGG
jgi:micrococcal nuclease